MPASKFWILIDYFPTRVYRNPDVCKAWNTAIWVIWCSDSHVTCAYASMPLIVNPRRYTIKRKANTLHPTTGLCTQLLGFAPDHWALHPTTGLCITLLGFHPNTEFLTQTPKGSHSSDQRTLIGYFPLNSQPLLMAYSHVLCIFFRGSLFTRVRL